MRNLYMIANSAMTTTAPAVPVTTGTAAKTMLQVLHPTAIIRVVQWGISFNGSAAAVPITCELLTSGTVAATVTAHVAAGVQPFSDPNLPATGLTFSTTGTGYTASAEGTITTTRIGDMQLVAPTNGYAQTYALGDEFQVKPADVLRIRVLAPAAVSALCYVVVNL
jgi:hypothetical protein